MEIKTMVGIGVGIAGLAAGEVYSLWRMHKMSKEIEKFNASVDSISRNIDVEVPDVVVAAAMTKAADREAEKSAKAVVNLVSADIQDSVDKAIKKEKDNIEESVRTELEKKISLVDIEDIKSKVITKAGVSVANDVMSRLPILSSTSSDIANVIRACKDAGMSTWQIESIVKDM